LHNIPTNHGHLCTPTTCPQSEGKGGAQEYPGSPSSPLPRSTMSNDPGTKDTSSKAASQDGLRPVSLEGPGSKAAQEGAPVDQGSAPFIRPSLVCDDVLAPAAPVWACASAFLPRRCPWHYLSLKRHLRSFCPHCLAWRERH
jgi:hypothetical protein